MADRASTGGVSLVDVDADGDCDLYVTNGYDVSAEEPSPQPNRLYLNDGGALTVSEGTALTADAGFSSGSTWADMDNDGDLDVFVTNQRDQENFLYRNDGGLRFVRVADGPFATDGGHSYSASWVDVDSDGLVDLFVANGGISHSQVDFLYRNLGGAGFERVTEGPLVTDEGASGGAAWADFDDDGDQDVVVTSFRFNTSPRLYRNDGGFRFTRVDGALEQAAFASSSAAWGDLDGDGDLDLAIGGVHGLANRIFRNLGDGTFERIVDDPAAMDGGNTYALAWLDADDDRNLDLLVADWGAAPSLFGNRGGGRFVQLPVDRLPVGVFFASSVATGDLDGDGRLDVVLGAWPNRPGPEETNQVLMNRSAAGAWVAVELVGTRSNRSAIGARLEVSDAAVRDGGRVVREVQAHSGWRSQGDLVQVIGVGDWSSVDVTVRWPAGGIDRRRGVAAGTRVRIVEGE